LDAHSNTSKSSAIGEFMTAQEHQERADAIAYYREHPEEAVDKIAKLEAQLSKDREGINHIYKTESK